MSELYIKAGAPGTFLEAASPREVRESYAQIKSSMPEVRLTIFGAKDAAALRRFHRHLDGLKIEQTVPDFLSTLPSSVSRKEKYSL